MYNIYFSTFSAPSPNDNYCSNINIIYTISCLNYTSILMIYL